MDSPQHLTYPSRDQVHGVAELIDFVYEDTDSCMIPDLLGDEITTTTGDDTFCDRELTFDDRLLGDEITTGDDISCVRKLTFDDITEDPRYGKLCQKLANIITNLGKIFATKEAFFALSYEDRNLALMMSAHLSGIENAYSKMNHEEFTQAAFDVAYNDKPLQF